MAIISLIPGMPIMQHSHTKFVTARATVDISASRAFGSSLILPNTAADQPSLHQRCLSS
jgi:hypothetical protein